LVVTVRFLQGTQRSTSSHQDTKIMLFRQAPGLQLLLSQESVLALQYVMIFVSRRFSGCTGGRVLMRLLFPPRGRKAGSTIGNSSSVPARPRTRCISWA